MKKLIVVIVIFCMTSLAFAKYVPYKHGLDVNIGGPASIISAEYQYNILVKDLHTLGVSAGFGMTIGGNTIPLGVQYRFGKIHQVELGIHATTVILPHWIGPVPGEEYDYIDTELALSARLGYRININRFFMHINIMPAFPQKYTTGSLGLGVYLGSAVLDKKIKKRKIKLK